TLSVLCLRLTCELVTEAILVELHRSGGEMEDGCSLLGRPTFGQELQNLTLSRRQPIRCVLTHARAAETIFTFGESFRICLAASRPLSEGMEMSRTTTSGLRSPAVLTAALPSSTVPPI